MAVFTPELRDRAERVKARYPAGRERSAVLPLLYLAQSIEGWVSREGLREVAEILGLLTAEVEAVASFYTMIRLRPTGRHVVNVCTNLSCALRGANEVYAAAHRALQMPPDGEMGDGDVVTLHEEECLGACDAAPVVQVDFANHDRVTPEGIVELIEALRRGELPAPARGTAPRDFRAASGVLSGLGEVAE